MDMVVGDEGAVEAGSVRTVECVVDVWVPTVNVDLIELTSKRLRNYEFSAVVGFLADRAWLR
jgi:hypothetical protein